MDEPNQVIEHIDSVLQKSSERIDAFVAFFERLDESSPLLRLGVAGCVIGISLLLYLISRRTIGKRILALEKRDPKHFSPLRIQAQDLLASEDMKKIRIGSWCWLRRALTLIFAIFALSGFLLCSPWTLSLAAYLMAVIMAPIRFIVHETIRYLPNIITIVVIVYIARLLVRALKMIFNGIKKKRIRLKNFYPEWADPSFALIKLLVYVLTAVIVFPYLPGSSSPAFQGISIFLGLLISLGSSTAVANIIAGTVLTYTRAFAIGDQVMIAQTRGKVLERSTFVTRIQTLKNEVVSIPNSMVLSGNIINYSQHMGQHGILVHSKLTIGYEVPWQKVNKLLINAAVKTESISVDPKPFVLQTSLDDYYVSYEINGWTHKPEELPRIYSNLHANILDEFHTNQVEITSPAFRINRDGNKSTIPEVTPSSEKPA